MPTPVFRHGVASGDPLSDRVILWTRTERSGDVGWTVATDEALHNIVATGVANSEEAHDLTVKVDVTGLEPDTTYYYFFRVGGESSPVGRTRTLPKGGVDLRFAMYSCAKYNAGYFNAFGRMAERDDLAFILCLGDYIYEYGNDEKGLGDKIGRAFVPGTRMPHATGLSDSQCQLPAGSAVAASSSAPSVHQHHRRPRVLQ